MPIPCIAGRLASLHCPSAWTPQNASNKPKPPPARESSTLSVSNWRATRSRPAPSATRTAISGCRAAARASRRLATFAQAMSRTNATAPSNTSNAPFTSPTNCSCRPIRVKTPSPPSPSPSVLLAGCAARLFATRFAPVGASHRVSIERSLSETSCPLHLFHQAPAESKVETFLDIESAPEEPSLTNRENVNDERIHESNKSKVMPKIKTVHGIENRKVVSQKEWLAARQKLLVKEKKFTKLHDELNLQRRKLPWVKIEKEYAFDGPTGKVTLADLFCGKSQLIIYHFMFGPGWKEGCEHCSFWADHFDSVDLHIGQRDTTFAVISRAPLA